MLAVPTQEWPIDNASDRCDLQIDILSQLLHIACRSNFVFSMASCNLRKSFANNDLDHQHHSLEYSFQQFHWDMIERHMFLLSSIWVRMLLCYLNIQSRIWLAHWNFFNIFIGWKSHQISTYPKYCWSEMTETHMRSRLTVYFVRTLNEKLDVLTVFSDTKLFRSLKNGNVIFQLFLELFRLCYNLSLIWHSNLMF